MNSERGEPITRAELDTLAHAQLKPTPLSWSVNFFTVMTASEFSINCTCVSFHYGCFFVILNLPHDIREWLDVRGRVKIISARGWGAGSRSFSHLHW